MSSSNNNNNKNSIHIQTTTKYSLTKTIITRRNSYAE
jgi:hypothetical protein